MQFDKVNDSGKRAEFNTGSKRDTQEGKGRPDLIPIIALRRLAQHYENGANKYGDRNWEKGQPLSRYYASCQRHLWAFMEGDYSEDHLAAVMWNAAAIIHHIDKILAGELSEELDDIGAIQAYHKHMEDKAKKDAIIKEINDKASNIVKAAESIGIYFTAKSNKDAEKTNRDSIKEVIIYKELYNDCTVCNNKRVIDCPQCSGHLGTYYDSAVKQHVSCAQCNGLGRIHCKQCHISQTLYCQDCNNSKKIECIVCHGLGRAYIINTWDTCPRCKGKGKVACKECSVKKESYCQDCNGKQKIECPECHGTNKHYDNRLEEYTTCDYCDGRCVIDCKECT